MSPNRGANPGNYPSFGAIYERSRYRAHEFVGLLTDAARSESCRSGLALGGTRAGGRLSDHRAGGVE
jgi:hypothetical protein